MNSFTFRNVSTALPKLMDAVLEKGDEVGSRNGRTMELPFTHITLTHPQERYIMTPHRKAALPAQIAETMWILAGRNDIEWLSHYLPRAAEFSDDGKTWRGGYGPRLRDFGGDGINPLSGNGVDQLKHVVELLNNDPLTRRAVIGIYDPVVDTDPGKDIPCNDFIQFMSRLGKLDMHVFIRSNDLMWGWSGINAFEWSALQEIVAGLVGVQVGHLHFSISSLHLYDQHWNKASKIAEAGSAYSVVDATVPFAFHAELADLDKRIERWFEIEEDIRRGDFDSMDILNFPEPMLRSWLEVLAYHWTGDEDYLRDLPHAMRVAALESPKRPPTFADFQATLNVPIQNNQMLTPFVAYVDNLHREKDKAYKGSWKRRGEMLGIMANIARKVDRLGYTGAGDTATDTAIDLMVYLIKYRLWLDEQRGNSSPLNELDQFTEYLQALASTDSKFFQADQPKMEKELIELFEVLEHKVEEKRIDRWEVVDRMVAIAYLLASHMWWKDSNATRAFTGYPS